MVNKTIEFGYAGGEYVQYLKVRSENLPFNVLCESEWVVCRHDNSSVTFKVAANTGFEPRETEVSLTDRLGNRICVGIKQEGFTNLRIACVDEVAIPYGYYSEHDTYDLYVTVYGGPTQGVKTRGLTKNIECVWNASETYKDYILHIGEDVSGNYTLTHSDAKAYTEYCKANGIPYQESDIKHKIKIIQLTESDMTGVLKLECDGNIITNQSPSCISVEYLKDTVLLVKECSYRIQSDTGGNSTVNETSVYAKGVPEWIDCSVSDGVVTIHPNRPNPFANERRADIKLSSPSNPKLFATVSCVQRSSAVKD